MPMKHRAGSIKENRTREPLPSLISAPSSQEKRFNVFPGDVGPIRSPNDKHVTKIGWHLVIPRQLFLPWI